MSSDAQHEEAGHGEHAAPCAAHHGEFKHDNLVPQLFVLTLVVLLIVGLLLLFEKGVHLIRHALPGHFRPILEHALAEIATLGFVGLVVQFAEIYFEEQIHHVSEWAFGDGHMLVHAFEWFHMKFFQVAIVYFGFCGALLVFMIRTFKEAEVAVRKADANGDGDVTIEEFEAGFGKGSLQELPPLKRFAATALKGGVSHADEYLFSRRFMNLFSLPNSFNPGIYMQTVGGKTLVELVEFSPLTWGLVLPPLVYLEQIKVAHGVPMDDSAGAAAGAFITANGGFMTYFVIFFEFLGLMWAWHNFEILRGMNYMLRPRVAVGADGAVVISAPRLYDDGAIDAYLTRHARLLALGALLSRATGYAGAATHPHHRLFGRAGSEGPELLLLSIKLHTWIVVMCVFFCLGTVVIPGLVAMASGGGSAVVQLEVGIYSAMGLSFVLLLVFVSPATFGMYNIATACEGFPSEAAIKAASAPAAAVGVHAKHAPASNGEKEEAQHTVMKEPHAML